MKPQPKKLEIEQGFEARKGKHTIKILVAKYSVGVYCAIYDSKHGAAPIQVTKTVPAHNKMLRHIRKRLTEKHYKIEPNWQTCTEEPNPPLNSKKEPSAESEDESAKS